MSYSLPELKALFRKNFPRVPGGPTNKARSAGAIESLDALAEVAYGTDKPVTVESITNASAAGRAMAKAGNADAQLALVDSFSLAGDPAIGRPDFTRAYKSGGALRWLVQQVSLLLAQAAPAQPAAPTAGQVDDQGDTFSFLANSTYPSFASYKVAGLPGVTGAVALDGTNSYVQGGRIYVKVVGAVAKGGLAVYVASSGNVPDGKVLTNSEAFTGAAVTPTPQPVAPIFSGFDDVANTVSVSHPTLDVSELLYDFGGATGMAVPLNNVVSVGNAAGQVTAYARATSTRPEGVRAKSQPFTVAASNNAPTVSLSSPQAGQTLNVGDPVVLNAAPQDADGAADLKKVEFLDNGQVFNTLTTSPWTVQNNLTAGAHSFTARVYDLLGATGLSNTVSVTAAAQAAEYPAQLILEGDSWTEGGAAYPDGSHVISWVEKLKATSIDKSKFPLAGWLNKATSGQSADDTLAQVQGQIITSKDTTNYKQTVAVLMIGLNDERIGESYSLHPGQQRTPQQIAHDILEWGRRTRLAGIKPVLVTFGFDRSFVNTNPSEDSRMVQVGISANNLTISNAAKYGFVQVVDLTSDAFIGTPSAPINYANDYFVHDKIHPSDKGEVYLASKIRPAIESAAAMALPAFTDPGEYVAPVDNTDTSTGPGPDTYTPYALIAPQLYSAFNSVISGGTTITGTGTAPTNDGSGKYWGTAQSKFKQQAVNGVCIFYSETTVNENNKETFAGWTDNVGTDRISVKFGWHFRSQSYAQGQGSQIYGIRAYGDNLPQNGNNNTGYISYQPGDVLRTYIIWNPNTNEKRVLWYQNKVQRYEYTLTTQPVGYFLNVAVVPGGAVNDLRVGANSWVDRGVPDETPTPPVTDPDAGVRKAVGWQAQSGFDTSSNTLVNNNTTTNNFDQGTRNKVRAGSSSATVRASFDFAAYNDGSVTVVGLHPGTDAGMMVGEVIASNAAAFYLENSNVSWFIGGNQSSTVAFTNGDVFRMDILASQIVVYRNSDKLGTYSFALADNSFLDTSFARGAGVALHDVFFMAAAPVAY